MKARAIPDLQQALELMKKAHNWRDVDMMHHNDAETVRYLIERSIEELQELP